MQTARKLALAGALTTLGVGTSLFLYTRLQTPISADAGTGTSSKPTSQTFKLPWSMLSAKQLTVLKVEQVNHDTKRIVFALPGGEGEVSGVPVSGAILTTYTPEGKWLPVPRPYSPVHDRSQPGVLELLVKKYEGGVASTYLHSLSVGQKLDARGPLPGYDWQHSGASDAGKSREIILVAGGAGITPLYSLAQGVLGSDPNAKMHLLWGVNGTRDIILKEELASLQSQHPGRLQITYTVSGGENLDSLPQSTSSTTYQKGYINKPLLDTVAGRIDPTAFGDVKGTKVFFCGPPKMEEALTGKKGVLAEMGITGNAVHKF